MLEDIINTILEAEREADETLRDASARARDMLTAAERAATECVAECHRETKDASRAQILAADRQGDSEVAEQLARQHAESQAAATAASDRITKAAALVVDKLRAEYGNR